MNAQSPVFANRDAFFMKSVCRELMVAGEAMNLHAQQAVVRRYKSNKMRSF